MSDDASALSARGTKRDGWQSSLLSSSVPLEYQVARILKRSGFHIAGEWSYHRVSETGAEKEPSVDLRAVTSLNVDSSGVRCPLDLLVECKYRHRNVSWLFLPHPNEEASFLHSPLEGIDHFAPWFIHNSEWDLKDELSVCYKGTEVGFGKRRDEFDDGDVGKRKNQGEKALPSQIKHGIAQLQFALPSIVALRIRAGTYGGMEDIFPFFMLPMLVTNADLIVARTDLDMSMVEAAETPADLGERVGALTLHVEPGPEFYDHMRRQLSDLSFRVKSRTLKAIEEFRRSAGFLETELPTWVAERIAREPTDAVMLGSFSNFLVCNLQNLESTLDRVRSAFLRSAQSLRKEPIIKWQ